MPSPSDTIPYNSSKTSFLIRFANTFNYYLLILIAIGTPLFFSSYTRSVFEVNKLLLLRLASILIGFFWLLRYRLQRDLAQNEQAIQHDTDQDSESKAEIATRLNLVPESNAAKASSFWHRHWKPVGLEIPILLWILFNILSTVFSQNMYIALIGAYDRWEGIFTVINYMFLFIAVPKFVTTRSQLHGLIAAIIIPTALSSVYGVFQSLGMDFMHWSVDPTARVFACINNPVHFCPYVSMVMSLALGTLLYLAKKTEGSTRSRTVLTVTKWSLFFFLVLIYFTAFLSFSRGTWLGLVLSLTVVFMMIHRLMFSDTNRAFIIDFFATGVGLFALQVIVFLNVWAKGFEVALPFYALFLLYIVYVLIQSHRRHSFSIHDWIYTGLFLVGLTLLFLSYYSPIPDWYLLAPAILILLFSCRYCADHLNPLFARFIYIVLFITLQFVPTSTTTFLAYLFLVLLIYLLLYYQRSPFNSETRVYLMSLLVIFASLLFIPGQIQSYRPAAAAQSRIQQYNPEIADVNPRVSMWKSAVVWIQDYWLFGTGPDTIKFMYPKYRRPEYGILEGGHNFTPDKLHNEYLNTMATRGVPATLVYYVGIMGGWFVLLLPLVRRLKDGLQYVVMGVIGSALIYLVQVMFNFGVVATFVVFYLITGLGLAIRSIVRQAPYDQ